MTSQMTPDVERNVSEINPEEMFLRFFNEASLVPVPPWQRLDDIQELLGDQAFKFARGLRGRLSRTPSQTQTFTVVCNCEQFLSTLIGTIFETSSNSRTLDETVNNIAIFLVPLGTILIWFFNSLKVLREVGQDDLLSQREKLNHRLQEILDLQTGPWGITVALVEIQGVHHQAVMQRTM